MFTESPSYELKYTCERPVALDGSGAANVLMFDVALPLIARYWCETSRGSETLNVVLPLELCLLVAIVSHFGDGVSSVSVVSIVSSWSSVFCPFVAGENVAVTVLPLPVMGSSVAPMAAAGPTAASSESTITDSASVVLSAFMGVPRGVRVGPPQPLPRRPGSRSPAPLCPARPGVVA